MPEFRMTLKILSSNKKVMGGSASSFLHFQVVETKMKNSDTVNYEINPITGVKKDVLANFQKRLAKVALQDQKEQEQKGGIISKKNKYVNGSDYDDDDEISDYFDLEAERPRRGPLVYEPISYYWYDPFVYPLVDRWYVPTFVLPLQPRVVYDSHSLLYWGRY
jgi:hypothetical protein